MEFTNGITEEVVSSTLLKQQQEFASNQLMASYLRKRGYTKYASKINYEGTYHNIWFKGISKGKVNKAFRDSMTTKTKG